MFFYTSLFSPKGIASLFMLTSFHYFIFYLASEQKIITEHLPIYFLKIVHFLTRKIEKRKEDKKKRKETRLEKKTKENSKKIRKKTEKQKQKGTN